MLWALEEGAGSVVEWDEGEGEDDDGDEGDDDNDDDDDVLPIEEG